MYSLWSNVYHLQCYFEKDCTVLKPGTKPCFSNCIECLDQEISLIAWTDSSLLDLNNVNTVDDQGIQLWMVSWRRSNVAGQIQSHVTGVLHAIPKEDIADNFQELCSHYKQWITNKKILCWRNKKRFSWFM